MFGQALAAMRPRLLEAGRLPGGQGQPGGRIQVLRVGKRPMGRLWAVKRPPGPSPPRAGWTGPARGASQQPEELALHRGDVGLQGLVAGRVAAQALGARLGVGWWSQQPPASARPRTGRRLGQPTQRPRRPRPEPVAGQRRRPHTPAPPVPSAVQGQGAAIAGQGGRARAERLELIVEPFLADPRGQRPATSVTDRPRQGVDGISPPGGRHPGAPATTAPHNHGRRS